MNILVAGGTGLLGRAITRELIRLNHFVILLSRDPKRAELLFPPALRIAAWDGYTVGPWVKYLDDVGAVINLAGESIGENRWSPEQKERLVSSRVQATRTLVSAVGKMKKKPRVFVSASGVGYYGNVADGDVTEKSPRGADFLAEICHLWEREALKAERLGMRVVLLRSGVVLSKYGGALKKMLLPFRLFVGGPLGGGHQWFPWVHIDDAVAAFVLAIFNKKLSGPVNLAAPGSTTMAEFCSSLGRSLRRPSWMPVPGFALRLALGEMAGPLLLSGQKAVPKKLLEAGFQFQFPNLDGALRNILYPELDFIERGV
ncbi:MAG: TIGR01777 family oxidoreductase [Bacteroidota bacterium]